MSKRLPLYTQRMDLHKPSSNAGGTCKFTDAPNQWGGVADYEYSPYTVFSTGEGKRAQYSIAKTDSSETPRVIFAEKDANVDRNDWRQHLPHGPTPVRRTVACSKAAWRSPSSGLEADRRRAEGRGAESFVVTKKNIIVREKRELLERLRVLDLNGNMCATSASARVRQRQQHLLRSRQQYALRRAGHLYRAVQALQAGC